MRTLRVRPSISLSLRRSTAVAAASGLSKSAMAMPRERPSRIITLARTTPPMVVLRWSARPSLSTPHERLEMKIELLSVGFGWGGRA